MPSILSITIIALLHPHSATAASIVYDDFTSYNTSVWDYADHAMGTTVRGRFSVCPLDCSQRAPAA